MTRPGQIPVEDIAAIVRNWPTSSGYGPYIAGRYGVPLATARRWVYETRRRGLLEPGTSDRPCPYCEGSGVSRWGSRPPRGHAAPALGETA